MVSFVIQRGAVALCAWDVGTGKASLHARAIQTNGLLVIDESEKVSFVLIGPSEEDEYRVSIGDYPLSLLMPSLEDSGGAWLGDRIMWRQLSHFESARGRTRILVERQPHDSSPEQWTPLFSTEIGVIPSKLGEARYERMADEMQKVSRDLLVDLYGKSQRTHDLRLSREGSAVHSHDEELFAIESVVKRLGPLLRSVNQRPASRVATVSVRRHYWGQTPLTPASISWMSKCGKSPRHSERPLSVLTSKKVESFDIPEHRAIRAFLVLLSQRASYCLNVAKVHARAIQSDRYLRDIRFGNGPTLYESFDVPRIRRLELAATRAMKAISLASAISELPFLRGVEPQLIAIQDGTFQRNSEYRVVLQIVRQFLLTNAVWYHGDGRSDVTKLTSRLFEQWAYLRVVEGFRSSGLQLREWDDALRQSIKSRFILDFDRGLTFDGELTEGLRLRFRYEPWILSSESAVAASETLCRGSSGDVAWSPDIVIECLRIDNGVWRPVYAVVMDCKYTSVIREQHWNGTAKYLQIRSVHTKGQVVRQLWLVAPSAHAGIVSEDPAVDFSATGPTCEVDEQVRFQLLVTPGTEDASDPFCTFAAGIMAYLRRTFGKEPATRSIE